MCLLLQGRRKVSRSGMANKSCACAELIYCGVILRGNSDHGSIPPQCTVVTRSYCAVEVVRVLSYVAYITEGLTMLLLRDNVSESWENDLFLVIWTHFRLSLPIWEVTVPFCVL